MAWRARERLQSLGGGRTDPSDGLPLPPARMRVMVSGGPDPRFFLGSGKAQAGFIRSLLASNGIEMNELESVLDFGCGCGRVARWWATLDGPGLHGCDYNPELAGWCDANLPFLQARASGLGPPLPYADASFDLVYALSVFTHLPEELQVPWRSELERVLNPGGLLLITVSGESYLGNLTPTDLSAFREGSLVTHFEQVAGTNMCAAYHPPDYVRGTLLAGMEIVDLVAGSDQDTAVALRQDTYLARKQASETATPA